jgi:hypothetical protein
MSGAAHSEYYRLSYIPSSRSSYFLTRAVQSLRWFRTLMIYNPVRNKYIGSLKHLKSLYTFTDKSLQPVLAGFEQQFIPAVAKASAVVVNTK